MGHETLYLSYGAEAVQAPYSTARKIVIILAVSTIVTAGILFYYYTITGDKGLLIAGVIILATLPVDMGILYSLLQSTKNKLPRVIRSLIEKLEPVSVGAVRKLGSTALSMKLRDGGILYITVSTNNIRGIYIADPSITRIEPGLAKARAPWRQVGIATVLANDLKAGFSLQCKSRIVELDKDKTYSLPDPEYPRTISVAGEAWYIVASCPTYLTPERLASLLAEAVKAIREKR